MNSGRLTILERLENRSIHGGTSAELNLYPRQAKKLINDGFSVEEVHPVAGRYGQIRYKISWRNAAIDSIAYGMLLMAASSDSELRRELLQGNFEPVKRPYSYS